MYQDEDQKEQILKRIANMFATVFIYSESPTLLDRFANALSKEAVSKVVYDAERIVQMGLDRKDITLGTAKIEDKEYPAIIIKAENKSYTVIGSLPSDKDVEDFLSLIEKDIYYARKAGALAMSIVTRVKSKSGGEEK